MLRLSLPRKSVVRITDCPDMTSAVYHVFCMISENIWSQCTSKIWGLVCSKRRINLQGCDMS